MASFAKSNGDVEAPGHSGAFGITAEELNQANENKDLEFVKSHGMVPGVAQALRTNLATGLDPANTGPESIEARRQVFGANRYKEVPPKNFFVLVWEVIQDPILLLLIFAATVSTVLGSAIPEEREKNHWIEGVAIWFAVILVTLVSAGNDYSKDKQFRKINSQKDHIMVKVIRGGKQLLAENTDIVVGDVMLLDTGDKVIADGLVIDTQGLTIDEASLTGESDPIKKNPLDDPFVRSGTQVTEGSGHILVVAVGEGSEWGKTLALVGSAGDEETPLQVKLGTLATAIGYIGFGVAVACFIAQLIKWCVENKGFPIKEINNNGPVQFFLYSITIIVVAVPEGLPLAVTISLAYSMKKMMKDNNFVRVLAACETMGGATAICSDKTGTLTENRMTVVEGWFAGQQLDHTPATSELHPELVEQLKINMALNSKAFLIEEKDGRIGFVGNRTECALLMLMNKGWGMSYEAVRHEHEQQLFKMYGFSSAKKMASCLIQYPDKYRLYNKGAAEWVLRRCTGVFDGSNGTISPMTDAHREQLMDIVTGMAKRGLRCICMAYTDYALNDPGRPQDFFEDSDQVDNNLVAMAIVGIKDPVRAEVPDAVATCKRAGITVRMVTGDNIHTARHIARECGILDQEDFVCMEGPTFRNTPEAEMVAILPHLRVLARSSPEDKLTLVNLIKKQGDVVAVTGDGTNDAPALKASDVGLAMGIAGTEVAKEAADIVILDDNFSSIVKSVLWGRCVFANIRKFLQFQLTVNFVALITAFIGAVVGGQEPLNVLQLLWVNLIMDTMGALALATEEPNRTLLDQKPNGKTEKLINLRMCKHIVVQGMYQMFWMFFCLYALPKGIIAARYKVRGEDGYYQDDCGKYSNEYLNGQPKPLFDNTTQTAWTQQTASAFICSALNNCGFPYGGENRDNPALCQIKANNYPNSPVPDDEVAAVCGPAANGAECDMHRWLQGSVDKLDKEYEDWRDKEYRRPLSLLFNIFIMCQIANEINSRRINDELDIFSGFFHNWIFSAVIVATFGLQAIIINFLGLFFKVEPLDWKEWLVSIAIGMGAFPISLATRWLTRYTPCCGAPPVGMTRQNRWGKATRNAPKHADDQPPHDAEAGLPHSNGTPLNNMARVDQPAAVQKPMNKQGDM